MTSTVGQDTKNEEVTPKKDKDKEETKEIEIQQTKSNEKTIVITNKPGLHKPGESTGPVTLEDEITRDAAMTSPNSPIDGTLRFNSVDIYENVVDKVDDYRELATVRIGSYHLWKMASSYDHFLFHETVVDWWSVVIHYGVEVIVSLLLVAFVLLALVGFTVLSRFSGENGAGYRHSVYVNSDGKDVAPQYPNLQNELRWQFNHCRFDVEFLAETIYHYDTDEHFDAQFTRYYNNSSPWSMVFHQTKEPVYYYVRHNSEDLDIMVIRGTKSFEDLMQDLALFSEVVTLNIFSWFIPLETVLPKQSLRDAVYYAAFGDFLIDERVRKRFYYSHLLNELNDIAQNYTDTKNRTLIVVGHSLGGALAQIIAAKLFDTIPATHKEVFSFGLSSPGLVYSSRKFGVEIEPIERTSISLYSQRDLVPRIDTHEGLIETVECRRDYELECHIQSSIYCEVYTSCLRELGHDDLSDCFCLSDKNIYWKDCY
ncbi:hypothetical protein RFI_21863 [Reticulomyxa filosa]|uniref:Fungal lipase-type domain-containing protein n=1 Tax=Reticulomyxa filosa TaxID=46433 RepID=X6MND4_RETFI|nr:hypothetical protein RFI_21863 [Reticulomyxa filosa]|eukprot:ETO15503.1 hypothetical protein RFI_21863 [Reticulomyxa filosa]